MSPGNRPITTLAMRIPHLTLRSPLIRPGKTVTMPTVSICRLGYSRGSFTHELPAADQRLGPRSGRGCERVESDVMSA
jgi:hypothetical protein